MGGARSDPAPPDRREVHFGHRPEPLQARRRSRGLRGGRHCESGTENPGCKVHIEGTRFTSIPAKIDPATGMILVYIKEYR